MTNSDGIILEVNAAAERIFESPLHDLKGKSMMGFCTNPNAYDELFERTTREGRAINRPLVLMTASGKKKLVSMSIARVDKDNESLMAHVFQDCADLRSLEERLLQAERLATVGRFASQIAHEIRNPLSSISLNVEMLEDEVQGSEEARRLIRAVLKELDHLNDIVGEYLQFSRFPKPNLKKGSVDATINELAHRVKLPAAITLESQLASPSPEIWLDEGLLRRAIDNLVRNAVESIDGSGKIRIETEVIERFLVIRVRDTGIGIPPEAQEQLFEPFYTTKSQGTGLGLATTQQIIFEHNGHIQVESKPGQGSTFSIYLPL